MSCELDRVLEGDRRFFRRHPDRRHRVRLASSAEVTTNEAILGRRLRLPPGHSHFVAVRQIVPGVRERVFLHGSSHASTDVPEMVARKIFQETRRGTGAKIDEAGGRH